MSVQDIEAQIHKNYLNLHHGPWLNTPMVVSIETYSKCNASCEFCPYTSLNRINSKLETDYVYSLIDEIANFTPAPQRINFSRVNEPFLDTRIFEFLKYTNKKIPSTKLILFSNGQTITDNVIKNLNYIQNISLLISFNEYNKDDYERVMGISYKNTISRLKTLHEMSIMEELNFSVSLSRVGTSDYRDVEFKNWCNANFPLFPVSSSARFNWIGSEVKKENISAPKAGCTQWFSLHILADKSEAFCCIDGIGQRESIEGKTLLEIYNRPDKKKLRDKITFRQDVKLCQGCNHGMPSIVD